MPLSPWRVGFSYFKCLLKLVVLTSNKFLTLYSSWNFKTLGETAHITSHTQWDLVLNILAEEEGNTRPSNNPRAHPTEAPTAKPNLPGPWLVLRQDEIRSTSSNHHQHHIRRVAITDIRCAPPPRDQAPEHHTRTRTELHPPQAVLKKLAAPSFRVSSSPTQAWGPPLHPAPNNQIYALGGLWNFILTGLGLQVFKQLTKYHTCSKHPSCFKFSSFSWAKENDACTCGRREQINAPNQQPS